MAEQELRRFSGSAPENYERYFVPNIGKPVADELIARAALRPGERVLDVACGTGVITRMAKERVGSGTVTGLDVTPGMLEVARSVTPPDMGITWHEANAESMPFPDASFDVVFCGLSLQLMPNKVTALREMKRTLVPGGRLLLSTPGRMPAPFAVIEGALGHHIGPATSGFVNAVFSLHDPTQMETLMSEAGLAQIRVEPLSKRLRMPAPREFLWQYIQSTPLAQAVMSADASKRDAMERQVVEGLGPFVDQGQVIYDQGILIGSARK
ncbi:MAG TPA: methyltransferase domain-containing protein [Candidatus Eisenbacteria bacterium]|nr:methyltransferase domain-containing protein [Candidatus Eisenbacteria bacterium]